MFEQKTMQTVIKICNTEKNVYKSGKVEVISDKSQPIRATTEGNKITWISS